MISETNDKPDSLHNKNLNVSTIQLSIQLFYFQGDKPPQDLPHLHRRDRQRSERRQFLRLPRTDHGSAGSQRSGENNDNVNAHGYMYFLELNKRYCIHG